MNKTIKKFHYKNIEHRGNHIIRKVTIKGGNGHKSVSVKKRGKRAVTIKKPLRYAEICMIKKGKFIPGLFKDCVSRKITIYE